MWTKSLGHYRMKSRLACKSVLENSLKVCSRPAPVTEEPLSAVNEDKCERLCLWTHKTKKQATNVNSVSWLSSSSLTHDSLFPST